MPSPRLSGHTKTHQQGPSPASSTDSMYFNNLSPSLESMGHAVTETSLLESFVDEREAHRIFCVAAIRNCYERICLLAFAESKKAIQLAKLALYVSRAYLRAYELRLNFSQSTLEVGTACCTTG
eukprot:6197098-Pleurochrysis_carterae.AAC.3